MLTWLEDGDDAGALATSATILPYLFPRLNASDVRVTSHLRQFTDKELAEPIATLERQFELGTTLR